jgi:hypothetical protein
MADPGLYWVPTTDGSLNASEILDGGSQRPRLAGVAASARALVGPVIRPDLERATRGRLGVVSSALLMKHDCQAEGETNNLRDVGSEGSFTGGKCVAKQVLRLQMMLSDSFYFGQIRSRCRELRYA